VARLKARGYRNIVVLDKHRANLAMLRRCSPASRSNTPTWPNRATWSRHFDRRLHRGHAAGADRRHRLPGFRAQQRRCSTRLSSTDQAPAGPRGWSTISSSVVVSVADDFYTRSKKEQERMVLASGMPCPILRPTLMFGWFDRKHLGWLSRFMRKVPVFPIPGHGRYMRQPLYVGDFSNVIISCIENPSEPASTTSPATRRSTTSTSFARSSA
jgi:uncharacterized protein YbjT (DUF2867 family)